MTTKTLACLCALAAACSDGEIGPGSTGAEPDAAVVAPPADAAVAPPIDAAVASSPDAAAASTPDAAVVPSPDAAVPTGGCQPTGGGPYWVEEGDTVTVHVACATGLLLPGDEFRFEALPSGASYDPAVATLTWKPRLDQAAVYDLRLRARGETGSVRVGVADRFDHASNVRVLDPLAYPEEMGLPVLFLDTAADIEHDVYVPATVTYGGRTWSIEVEMRGNSSIDYPKNSYTLKFPREDKFSDPARAGGFVGKRRVVLTTTFDDNSYLRQRLAYAIWARMDPGHIRLQTYSAVLYLNGRYHGLYLVSDQVKGYLMEDHGLWQDGNLYKAVTHDANFGLESIKYGGLKETLHQGLEKKEGFPIEGEPGAFDDIDALTQFVVSASSAEFRAGLGERIDLRDHRDWWIFVTLLVATDSPGKNAYHYRDPRSATARFRYLPWDLNASLGQSTLTERVSAGTWMEFRDRNHIFRRMLEDSTLAAPIWSRYRDLLAGPLAVNDILALLDGMIAEVAPSARRDERRWGAAYRSYPAWEGRSDFTTFDGEAAYLRRWVRDRWTFVKNKAAGK